MDDDDTAGGVELGYLVHRLLGVQAGYHDLGTYTGSNRLCPEGQICPLIQLPDVQLPGFGFGDGIGLPELGLFAPVEAQFTGVSLAAIPRWPVTERFALYGKLGILDWEGEISTSSVFGPLTLERPSGQDFLGGVGALYAFPSGFGLQLEAETTDLYDQVSLGSSWRF